MFRKPGRRIVLPAHVPFLVGAGMVFPDPVVLTALLVYGTEMGRRDRCSPFETALVRIEVTGHQWWWEVRYPATDRMHRRW
jgi:cytochrome c oxidase subunit II